MGFERQVTRRTVLRAGSRLLIVATGSSLYGLPHIAASPPVATRFAWTQADIPTGDSPFVSPVLESDIPFNALESRWDAAIPPSATLDLAVRTSSDGTTWSGWEHLHADSHARSADDTATFGDLIIGVPARFAQYAVRTTAAPTGEFPALRSLELTAVNTLTPPPDTVFHTLAVGGITIVPRSGWGADEKLRFDKKNEEIWPPEYRAIKKVIVHHTVTRDPETDPRATMRAIYQYHAVSRGWGDIGYNFLVDYFGRIWQGRAGNVALAAVGAHTGGFNTDTFGIAMIGDYSRYYAPAAVQTAVAKMFAWKLAMYGRSPYGTAVLTSTGGGTSRYPAGTVVSKPVVMGHLDVGATACPGRYGYAALPYIRSLTAKLMVTGATDGGPTGPWPLTGDQIFAYSGGPRVINGSDAQAAYRPYIAAIQREVVVAQTSRYDSATVNGVSRWQGLVGLPRTGVVDSTTWQTMTVR